MISYPEALRIVIRAARGINLATESLNLDRIVGRICADPVTANRSLQPFTNSAMDGFALRYQDITTHSAQKPNLRVRATICAGDSPPPSPLPIGACDRILTGAPLPPEADTVIPIENIEQLTGGEISVTHIPKPGANIRYPGEDITVGKSIIEPGTPIDPGLTLPLAALGISHLRVFHKPRVAVVTTGNEITRELGRELPEGQLFDSNHYYGQAFLRHTNAELVSSTHVLDDLKQFGDHLRHLMHLDLDCIISSGAVSAGAEHDFVRAGLEAIDAQILFHKVAIRPGKPNLFARLPNGTLYFGLPGNPLATAAGLRFFVTPALRAMTRQPDEPALNAQSLNLYKKKAGFSLALLSQCKIDSEQRLMAALPESQASFMTSPLLNSNCWALLNQDSERISPGEMIDIFPLLPQQRNWPNPTQ